MTTPTTTKTRYKIVEVSTSKGQNDIVVVQGQDIERSTDDKAYLIPTLNKLADEGWKVVGTLQNNLILLTSNR